ncbi:MAG: proton-conducting transporter membrane subunit, partial [Acetobacter orientalis]
SSFSQIGMIDVGLFTLTAEGIDGAIFQMLSHGVVIAALFFCVSAVAWRAETQQISALGGVARQMPVLALLAMLFTMANIGLPGTGSFVGELLVLMGAIHVSFWVALLAGATMIMGAVYMLALYKNVLFGSVKGTASLLRDLTGAEIAVLAPLAIVTLWMGIHPGTFTRLFDPVVMQAMHANTHAFAAANSQAVLHLAAR